MRLYVYCTYLVIGNEIIGNQINQRSIITKIGNKRYIKINYVKKGKNIDNKKSGLAEMRR